jgi:hypothetical protein
MAATVRLASARRARGSRHDGGLVGRQLEQRDETLAQAGHDQEEQRLAEHGGERAATRPCIGSTTCRR